jgi:tRNA (mo5U34)-methyltransferase
MELAENQFTPDDVQWFHSIRLGDTVTRGLRPIGILEAEADLIFRYPIKGKTFLDIGAWDGFFSFEAERRGARDVLSTDWFCWGGPGWGTKAGYDTAHRMLGSKCRTFEVDVPDLDPGKLGTFDVVLFSGVLYHVKDTLSCLERAAAMSHDLLIIETITKNNAMPMPLAEYAPGLDNDPTIFWLLNIAAIKAMLAGSGFKRVEVALNAHGGAGHGSNKMSNERARHVIFAWRE